MTRTAVPTLADHVAAAMRAEMARQQIPAYRLAARLRKSETWVGRRMNGDVQITIADLDLITAELGVHPASFLPAV